MNPRRKPINFVPRIDETFKRYFKADSLWYSEDLASIPGYDIQKAQIIHGPVAAKFITEKDETLKDVLGGIDDVVKKRALEAHYGGDIEKVPAVEGFPLLRLASASKGA